MIALLLRLYPARWRARYGDEFEALLAERPLGPFDVADVALGALDAHLHLRGLGSWSEHRRGFPMSLRIGAWAAIVGGALMLVGFPVASAIPAVRPLGSVIFIIGSLALLVALAGLSAYQAHRHPVVVWTAFLLPTLGAAITTAGVALEMARPDQVIVAGLSGWWLFVLGGMLTIVGSIIFALATWWTAALPRTGALALGGGAAIALATIVLSMGLMPVPPFIALAILAFPAGWVLFGVIALRADRPVVAPSPA